MASTWQELQDGRASFATRLALSIALGALLAGLALLGAWLLALSARATRASSDQIAVSLLVASVFWLGALYLIWSGYRFAAPVTGPLLMTVAALISVAPAINQIDYAVRDEETVITAFILFLSGALLLVWLPVIKAARGRSVVGQDGSVDVRCPGCGYSMVGLRELRCPECGATFTVDALIRAQRYARGQDESRERDGRSDAA